MLILILCYRSRRRPPTDTEAAANTSEYRRSSAVHSLSGRSGDHDCHIPQTEDQEVQSVL